MNSDMGVCGEASCLYDAQSLCLNLKPDLVVVDPSIDEIDGFNFIRDMCTRQPTARHLVFSGCIDQATIRHAFKAGAVAMSAHDDPVEWILSALLDANSGKKHLTPSIARRLTAELADEPPSKEADIDQRLSPREYEVFCLLGGGHPIKEVAARARMGVRTVESHLDHIKQKLHLQSNSAVRTQAILHVDAAKKRTSTVVS